MRIYNTLTRKIEGFKPLVKGKVLVYSCGPTVYDHIHIGNLRSFIVADILIRTLKLSGLETRHVMNFTDVDDKTIKRSRQTFPDDAPEEALSKLTKQYSAIFLDDMDLIGNDVDSIEFIKATDSIDKMQNLIKELYSSGFAYLADDGVYFSIEKYKASGKTYGQLLSLDTKNTSRARINNDEYDKESVHDFALWKKQKTDEPVWPFILDGHDLSGRPGWHIECSAMSSSLLGQPFDIHTGGVDLIFPHHENEIAQSTAGKNENLVNYFVHNEHLLVDQRKMSKSLNNFLTLRDIIEKGFDPSAFRLMILQSHYRSQTNFTWEGLKAAASRLESYRMMADKQWQAKKMAKSIEPALAQAQTNILTAFKNDLNTPSALAQLDNIVNHTKDSFINESEIKSFKEFLSFLDKIFNLGISERKDITKDQKDLLKDRHEARQKGDWIKSDQLREELAKEGVLINDTPDGQIWYKKP